MKPKLCQLFYSNRSFYKCFSLLFILFALLGVGMGCGGAGTPGGVNLPAPTADIEAGPPNQVSVCDTVAGAPSGSFVKITNTNNPSDPIIQVNLDANNSFSVLVCVKVGETLSLQLFDQAGNSSTIQTLTRTGSATVTCPTPTNPTESCP